MNQVNLAGYLAADPIIIDGTHGKFALLTIVTKEYGKPEPGSNEAKEFPEFHRVVALNERTAAALGAYAKKGTYCIITDGRLKNRKFIDKKTNQERYITEVVIYNGRNIEFHQVFQRRTQPTNESVNGAPNGADHAYQHIGTNGATDVDSNVRNFDDDIPF